MTDRIRFWLKISFLSTFLYPSSVMLWRIPCCSAADSVFKEEELLSSGEAHTIKRRLCASVCDALEVRLVRCWKNAAHAVIASDFSSCPSSSFWDWTILRMVCGAKGFQSLQRFSRRISVEVMRLLLYERVQFTFLIIGIPVLVIHRV